MSWTFVCFTCIIYLLVDSHTLLLRTFRANDLKSLQTSWWTFNWGTISIFRSHLIFKGKSVHLILVVLSDISCCIKYFSFLNRSEVGRIITLRLVRYNFFLDTKNWFWWDDWNYLFLYKRLFIINLVIMDWIINLHFFIFITFI